MVLLLCLYLLLLPVIVVAADLHRGPVVGGVTASEAKVFVRTNTEAEVAIRYNTDPGFADALTSASVLTSTAKDFTEIIGLAGLSEKTTYYLDVTVDGVSQLSSPFPSSQTFASVATTEPFKFIVLSDFADGVAAPVVPTFCSAAQEGAAFAFIGGDFAHKETRQMRTLQDKRLMFKQLYDGSAPGMEDFVNLILRQLPIAHHWDDHDAGANDIDRLYANWSTSRQAFEEYIPAYQLPSSPSIWQTFSYAHMDFFILDTRSQRDPNISIDDAEKSMLDGNNLGAAGQLEWLRSGLLSSTARWKIVFSSVPTNPDAKPTDSWGAFQTEWSDLRSFINSNTIGGVIFISGDLHMGAIDDGVASGFPEMLVPPANLDRRACVSGIQGRWSEGKYTVPRRQCNGYGSVQILTNPDAVVLEVKDQDGNVRVSYTVN